jgi:hypothetical protein
MYTELVVHDIAEIYSTLATSKRALQWIVVVIGLYIARRSHIDLITRGYFYAYDLHPTRDIILPLKANRSLAEPGIDCQPFIVPKIDLDDIGATSSPSEAYTPHRVRLLRSLRSFVMWINTTSRELS